MLLNLNSSRFLFLGPTKFGSMSFYSLPNMTYGQWLIYSSCIPKYYIDLFDIEYLEMRKCIETNKLEGEFFLTKLLSLVYEKKLSHKCMAIKIPLCREKHINIEIDKFPIKYWDEVKPLLKEKYLWEI